MKKHVKKELVFTIALLILLLTIGFGLAEILCRANGLKPEQPIIPNQVNISQSHLYKRDPTLGYVNATGTLLITENGYKFTETHLSDGTRAVKPLKLYEKADRPHKKIWIAGCSFTQGWSLNDNETFAWILQERFNNTSFVNFGVDGYGTIHVLLQFRETLKEREKPAVLIYVYGHFQDMRNTYLRIQKMVDAAVDPTPNMFHPYARLDKHNRLHYFMARVEYKRFPLARYSAFMNLLQMYYDRNEDHFARSDAVTKALIMELYKECKKNNVEFVLAGVSGGELLRLKLDFFAERGLHVIDISAPETNEYKNLPYYDHPNAKANKIFARKLGDFLQQTFTSIMK
jgi:hypothetical protein